MLLVAPPGVTGSPSVTYNHRGSYWGPNGTIFWPYCAPLYKTVDGLTEAPIFWWNTITDTAKKLGNFAIMAGKGVSMFQLVH